MTLLEVVVVLAVLFLLAALLLPTIGSAKRRVVSTHCLSQLRQVGMLMAGYAEENAGRLPPAHGFVTCTNQSPVAWTCAVLGGCNRANIFRCPELSQSTTQSVFNYFMGARAAFIEAGGQPASLLLSKIQFPSAYILSGDCNFAFPADDADPDNYTQDTLFRNRTSVHEGRLNVLFGDLHIEPKSAFDPRSMTFAFDRIGVNWEAD
jgi:prepilin-type processing-associated H-X9-DG protein